MKKYICYITAAVFLFNAAFIDVAQADVAHLRPLAAGEEGKRQEPLQLLDDKVYVSDVTFTPKDQRDQSSKPHYTRDVLMALLEHTAKDAQKTNETAIDFSRKTRKPVLVISVLRTGSLYTCAMDNWWVQLEDPKEKDRFDNEVRDTATREKISKLEAEFKVAKEWLDSGKIKWYVSVQKYFIPSSSELTLPRNFKTAWKKIIKICKKNRVNLMFVDETSKRDDETIAFYATSGFQHPFSFIRLRALIEKGVRRKPQLKYINVDEAASVSIEPDEFSVMFYRPARPIPEQLRGKYPFHFDRDGIGTPDNLIYAWFSDMAEVLGIGEGLMPPSFVKVHTNAGEMDLHKFVKLKIKELTGWPARNKPTEPGRSGGAGPQIVSRGATSQIESGI